MHKSNPRDSEISWKHSSNDTEITTWFKSKIIMNRNFKCRLMAGSLLSLFTFVFHRWSRWILSLKREQTQIKCSHMTPLKVSVFTAPYKMYVGKQLLTALWYLLLCAIDKLFQKLVLRVPNTENNKSTWVRWRDGAWGRFSFPRHFLSRFSTLRLTLRLLAGLGVFKNIKSGKL